MAFAGHTRRAFDSDLQILSQNLAEMGVLAERQVADAIAALTNGDKTTARRLVAIDVAVDALQRTIDARVVEMIARRQPVAVDLRQVLSILRIANELERIGDLAKNIGKRVLALRAEDMRHRAMPRVACMAAVMSSRLREVLDSFEHHDPRLAVDVWLRDEEVDSLCKSLSHEILSCMREDPRAVTLGTHLLFCTKNLERMGDHATNIAEAVYYMVEGRRLLGERPKVDVTNMMSAEWSGLSHHPRASTGSVRSVGVNGL